MPDPSSVPVHTVGFSWVAALVALLNLLVGGALVAVIKNAPKLRELANSRRKGDLDDMRERITELEHKVEDATSAAMRAQMQMAHLSSALGMVSAELERQSPGNPVIKQARDHVAQATHLDPMFGGIIKRMDRESRQEAAE